MKYDTIGNINALMELLSRKAQSPEEQRDLQSKLVGAARVAGLSDHEIDTALFDTYDGPVFYYP